MFTRLSILSAHSLLNIVIQLTVSLCFIHMADMAATELGAIQDPTTVPVDPYMKSQSIF